jgi:hypothetical protein
MRKPLSTIRKARTGAQTIGSWTVSTILPAKTETVDLGDGAECFCSPGALAIFSVSLSLSNSMQEAEL